MRTRTPLSRPTSTTPTVRPASPALCARSHTTAPGAETPRARHRTVLALVERDVVPRALARVDLARAGDLLLLVLHELEPLGDPAGRAPDREHDREHRDRQPQRLVDEARVEVHVRVELARDEVVVLERDALELGRDVDERVAPGDLEDVLGRRLDDLRPRVVVLVDPVAEAHQALVALLHALDEVGDVVLALDAAEHPQHRLVGAT